MKERFGSTPPTGEQGADRENRTEQLARFIETLAAEYRNSFGAPLDNEGRIDMEAYRSIYPGVDNDIFRTTKYLQEGNGGVGTPQEIAEARRLNDGEKLEMLAFASFAKNLGPEFIVARASHHDDQVNKVDTVILDSKTGNLVCAFDEIGDTGGSVYEKKQSAVREHNLEKGGATLKYGITIDSKKEHPTVTLDEVKNIPLFYVALPKDRIEKGLREFKFSRDQQSDFEKKLFEYFIGALAFQVQGLELYAGRLNPSLKKRLDDFKKLIEDLKRKQVGGKK